MKLRYIMNAVVFFVILAAVCGCSIGKNSALSQSAKASNPAVIITSATGSTKATASSAGMAGATASPSATETPAPSENPLVPEKNPPGDISDSQVFVKYSSTAGGYEFKAPEGWGRIETNSDVIFTDKFDGVALKITQWQGDFTVDGIKSGLLADFKNSGRAVDVKEVREKNITGGKAIVVKYESNSEPDSVTGKQVRLENQCYFFYKDGKLAAMTQWAPLGADNVDQWKLMSDSFRWK